MFSTCRLLIIFTLLSPMLARAQTPPKTEALSFESETQASRHRALRTWILDRASQWNHEPRGVHGNFLTERWCISPDGGVCSAVMRSQKRGTTWVSLELLHHKLPQVFGLLLDIAQFPKTGDLALRFAFSEGGKTITNDRMDATFMLLNKDRVDESVQIGQTIGLRIIDTDVSVTSPTPWRETLRKMTSSPKSLEEFATQMLNALQSSVDEKLNKGEIMGFDVGPYKGGGIPPERTARPLTAAEKEREAKAAKTEIDRRKAFVAKYAAAMHAILVAEVPLDQIVQLQ